MQLFLWASFGTSAQASLSHLKGSAKGWAVYSAVSACALPAKVGGCKYQYEVIAGHNHHVKNSCHYTKEAVDIKGTPGCLHAMATCLQTQLYVLFCFKHYPSAALANAINQGWCKPADHQKHIHVQPYGGCAK